MRYTLAMGRNVLGHLEKLEEKWEHAFLLDFYANMLPEKQRKILEATYHEDWSSAELADSYGISRQAVHDALKKGTETLERLEAELGMAKRYQELRQRLSRFEESLGVLNEEQSEYLADLKRCL